jgi:hypothetical protein
LAGRASGILPEGSREGADSPGIYLDLETAEDSLKEQIEREVLPRTAA